MSAGGLSYSAITNHGKITLPSVEGGFGSQNILRDPPKSIMTRRTDKVGDTSSITSMIDDSSNRACEAIQVYARGVNPFVSVSYGNQGNNGGQRTGGITEGIRQSAAAKLPYPIIRDGAFRPPVLLQEDLLPLSRMPRILTSSYSQPGFADFSRKMRTCGTSEDTKEVKTHSLKACIRPTAVYQLETPLVEPFEVKYVIQPSIKTSATSGVRTMDITQKNVGKPTKEIYNSPLHAMAQANYTDIRHVDNNNFNPDRYLQDTNAHAVVSNVSRNQHQNDNNDFNPDRYLQDTNVHAVVSNVSSNQYQTSIEDIIDLYNIPVHDIRTMSASAPVSGVEQTKYFHKDIDLSRSLPEYHARTNIGNNTVHKRMEYDNNIELERNIPMNSFVSNPVARGFSDHSSRNARLAPKIQPGGYSVPGQIPMQGRPKEMYLSNESEKARMCRVVMENMQGRFDKPAPLYLEK